MLPIAKIDMPVSRLGDSAARILDPRCEALPRAAAREPELRFDYDQVKDSLLAAVPQDIERATAARRAAQLSLHDAPGVTFNDSGVEHHLWRVSAIRQPEGRGAMYSPRWSGHSNAKMTLAERSSYLNSNYYQAAGELAPAEDPGYQFSVRLGVRDDRFATSSRIDVRVTPTEVQLLQHVTLQFDAGTPEYTRAAVRRLIQEAVAEKLDNKLDVVESRDGRQLRRALRLAVAFLPDAADGGPQNLGEDILRVRSGSGRADAATLYLSSSKGVVAHEMAHRMLAAEDEYEDAESLVKAPERLVRGFDVDEEIAGAGRARLMANSESGVLFPKHALAIAGLLRRALSTADDPTKFAIAFPASQQALAAVPAPEMQLKRATRAAEDGRRLIEDKLTDAGWEEPDDDYGGAWDRQRHPVIFRRALPRYIADRDALNRYPLDDDTRSRHFFSLPADLFLDHLVERLGYERFRAIVVPGDDAVKGFGKYFHEGRVIAGIAEALHDSLTEKGRLLIKRWGSEPEGVREALATLDRSASTAFGALVLLYGETAGTARAREAIQDAENSEAARFHSGIKAVSGRR